jgi:hypothetical protein
MIIEEEKENHKKWNFYCEKLASGVSVCVKEFVVKISLLSSTHQPAFLGPLCLLDSQSRVMIVAR